MRHLLTLSLFLTGFLFLNGCGGGAEPVYAGESEPDEFSLKHKYPEEFKFKIPEGDGGKYKITIELTFFPEQMQDWAEVPLYYILGDPANADKNRDAKFSIIVKDEMGWKGEMSENEHDRVLEQTVEKSIDMEAGDYVFRLYGDTTDEKPILGIVKVALKIYKA